MTASTVDYHQTTVQAFIAQLQPRAWNRSVAAEPADDQDTDKYWQRYNSRWDLHRFFDWPPDIFLLTSLLLNRTGAYRAGITPPRGELWPEATWPQTCRKHALRWRRWLCKSARLGTRAGPHPLASYIECLERCYKLPINDLYNVETVYADRLHLHLEAEIWNLCKCLMELHAIADETMRGVGTLFAPHVSLFSHEKKRAPAGFERIHLQANLLLALRGTLSRIGKHRGIVLPKSRTPQSGVTLRSLSLHLSFHHTEVDVAWRAVPWTNMDENTLNLLLVPWPYRIGARAFNPEMGPDSAGRPGRAGYFAYDPRFGDDGEGNAFDPADIVDRVHAAEAEAKRVHFLVFPEAALYRDQFEKLKSTLEASIHPSRMPVIIAGVTGRDSEGDAFNRVVLSVFYAQRWFDMVQDKHHRWKLDSDQIAGYSLGGTLSGTRSWWESIRIPRRRLSFLTSNAWLTLAPLICEDLARQEPVSDVIRGVGPTLLVALLLDGPQLTTRWPARYAGVLADDPGTSVLTLSSLGMCQRSLPARVKTREEAMQKREESGNTVALWNDQFWRWHEIKIGMEQRAALLTVATRWIQEDTFDMRAEAENSAVFAFQSIHVPKTKNPVRGSGPASRAAAPEAAVEVSAADAQQPAETSPGEHHGNEAAHADMNELTLYTFFVDALIDTPPEQIKDLRLYMYAVIGLLDVKTAVPQAHDRATDPELLTLSRWSLWHRKGNPAIMPTPHLFLALHAISRLVIRAGRNVLRQPAPRTLEAAWNLKWQSLVDVAEVEIRTCREQMEQDLRSRQDSSGGASQPYSCRLEILEKRAEQMAKYAHANAERREKVEPTSPPRLKRKHSGRLVFSAPLSILWAVHNRLSIRRRTRTLLLEENKLLTRVEKLLESDLHLPFQDWKKQFGETRV